MRSQAYRVAKLGLVFCCVGLLLAQLLALLDLDEFEFGPLYHLIGARGLLFVFGINVGICALTWRLLTDVRRQPRLKLHVAEFAVGLAAVLMLWAIDWMFLEKPLSVRLEQLFTTARAVTVPPRFKDDFERLLSGPVSTGRGDHERLAVMYERIRLVDPATYGDHPIGETIEHYSVKYGVDARVLFFLAYVHSFWGEAVSGRTPFLRAMTGETVRDVVQLHLPSWFIESTTRRWLAESRILERVTGIRLGRKLRYAVHKATLDVSAQPYELNTLSDIMLVLQEYPQEFGDVLGPDVEDPVRRALRDSFRRLGTDALSRPYEHPYRAVPRTDAYYDAVRTDIRRFARAAYYATALDFDLSTRFAALLIDYQRRRIIEAVGRDVWKGLPESQAAALLGMTRDVYVPNIGRFGPDVYALPELNCTPIEFVAVEASGDRPGLLASGARLWRPRDHERLWGAATTKLRIFSEVWAATTGSPFPDFDPEQSVEWSRQVVLMEQGR